MSYQSPAATPAGVDEKWKNARAAIAGASDGDMMVGWSLKDVGVLRSFVTHFCFTPTMALSTLNEAGSLSENQARLNVVAVVRKTPAGNRLRSQNSVANFLTTSTPFFLRSCPRYSRLATRATNGCPLCSDQNSSPPSVLRTSERLERTARAIRTSAVSTDR